MEMLRAHLGNYEASLTLVSVSGGSERELRKTCQRWKERREERLQTYMNQFQSVSPHMSSFDGWDSLSGPSSSCSVRDETNIF